jgi:hypothetical protein
MVIRDAPAPPVFSYTMVLETIRTSAWRDTSLRRRAAAAVRSTAARGRPIFHETLDGIGRERGQSYYQRMVMPMNSCRCGGTVLCCKAAAHSWQERRLLSFPFTDMSSLSEVGRSLATGSVAGPRPERKLPD